LANAVPSVRVLRRSACERHRTNFCKLEVQSENPLTHPLLRVGTLQGCPGSQGCRSASPLLANGDLVRCIHPQKLSRPESSISRIVRRGHVGVREYIETLAFKFREVEWVFCSLNSGGASRGYKNTKYVNTVWRTDCATAPYLCDCFLT
jgi:hypothetical protein